MDLIVKHSTLSTGGTKGHNNDDNKKYSQRRSRFHGFKEIQKQAALF